MITWCEYFYNIYLFGEYLENSCYHFTCMISSIMNFIDGFSIKYLTRDQSTHNPNSSHPWRGRSGRDEWAVAPHAGSNIFHGNKGKGFKFLLYLKQKILSWRYFLSFFLKYLNIFFYGTKYNFDVFYKHYRMLCWNILLYL